jgi:hypothetical protein
MSGSEEESAQAVAWTPRVRWVRSPRLDALGAPSTFADAADRARDVLSVFDLAEVTRHALLGDPMADHGPLVGARWRFVVMLVLRGELSRDEHARAIARRGRWSSLERERAALPAHPVEPSAKVRRYLDARMNAEDLRVGAGELPAKPRVRIVAGSDPSEREVWICGHEEALRHAAGLIEVENISGGPVVVRCAAYGADVPVRYGARVVLRWHERASGLWEVLAEDAEGDLLDPQDYALPPHLAAVGGASWRD